MEEKLSKKEKLERSNEQKRKWAERNPEYQKEYYERNKEQINQKKKECREALKEHYAEVAKKRYTLKREYLVSYQRDRNRSNPENMLLSLCKARAKRKGIPFNLYIEDIIIPKICPLLGVEIKCSVGKSSSFSPSLDRIIPELGYVKDNVWVVSHRANMLKSNSSLEELELIVKNLKERKLNK